MFQVCCACSAFGRGEWPTKNCLSDCYIPVDLRNVRFLGHQGQAVMGHLCVDFANLLALAKQLKSVGGGVCWLATERQWEYILTAHICGLQESALSVHTCQL